MVLPSQNCGGHRKLECYRQLGKCTMDGMGHGKKNTRMRYSIFLHSTDTWGFPKKGYPENSKVIASVNQDIFHENCHTPFSDTTMSQLNLRGIWRMSLSWSTGHGKSRPAVGWFMNPATYRYIRMMDVWG